MMRRAALLLLFVLTPYAAGAQTVSVRSGWQAAFTRLVLTIPEGLEWQLGRSGLDYRLVLAGEELIYDLDGVFDRIPGTRLAALDADNGSLRISLACACHATAFLWQPDRLVIDLVDGPPPDGSPFETFVNGVQGPGLAFSAEGQRVDEAPMPAISPGPAPPKIEGLMPDPFRVRTERPERLAAAEEALIRSIARAATQGLLTMRTSVPDRTEPPSLVEERPDPQPDHLTTDQVRQPGITARTSIDRDLGEADPFSATDDRADVVCLPQAYFAFETWGDERPFHTQISAARRSLVGEFDRLPPEAAADLARTYLFFGFGSEALGALALIEVPSEEQAVLGEIARLIDDLPETSDLLADQIGCRTPAALWALLGRSAIPARPELDRNGVLQHYKTLPAAVQGQVAGRLAPLFIGAGDEDAAAILLSRASRSPATNPEDVKLAEAELTIHLGDTEGSLQDMIATARTDGRIGPNMLLRIFELSVETDRPVPRDLLDLAGVLRFEHRGQPVVAELAAVETQAHLLAGDHDRALATIEDERKRLPAERLEALLSETLLVIAAEADDVAFLERVLPDPPRPLSSEAENAVARRLISLGMVGPAADVMQSIPVRDAAHERRYLRAEIALALEDFDRLEDLLTSMTDSRANGLRSAALLARGDYGEALAADTEAPNPGAAWRAGSWSRLAISPDPELSRVSALVIDRQALQLASQIGDPEGAGATSSLPPTIAEGLALVEESMEARELLEAVIDRFPVLPEDP